MSIQKDPYDFLGTEITGAMEVKVWAVGAGKVHYQLDDPKVSRTWNPGELKILTFHEIYQLANHPGGMFLLVNNLQIRDNKIRQALGLPTHPEYLYTEEDAKKLVLDGTREQILDALEFGPLGLASMMKHFAIIHVDSSDKIQFFNKLFSMNILELRETLDKEDESSTKSGTRRAVTTVAEEKKEVPKKRERKSEPLKPSEPLNQVATE